MTGMTWCVLCGVCCVLCAVCCVRSVCVLVRVWYIVAARCFAMVARIETCGDL